jgi:hypothetical protein
VRSDLGWCWDSDSRKAAYDERPRGVVRTPYSTTEVASCPSARSDVPNAYAETDAVTYTPE